jgi:hypothetical protein
VQDEEYPLALRLADAILAIESDNAIVKEYKVVLNALKVQEGAAP